MPFVAVEVRLVSCVVLCCVLLLSFFCGGVESDINRYANYELGIL